jgi:hypothetical protein
MKQELAQLPFRKRMEFYLARAFGWLIFVLLGPTFRFRVEGWEQLTPYFHSGKPALLALWHGRFFPFVYLLRSRGVVVMVSQHLDGEMIAQTLHRLGFRTVRGSSTRGGKKAFHEMVRALKEGKVCTIVPDGPTGPRHKLKPGVIYMAQQTGAPIFPLCFSARPALQFRSWDRFVFPLPFSRVFVSVGKMFTVPADADDRQLAQIRAELEGYMVEQERKADAFFQS